MPVLNTTGFVLILPYLDQAPLYNRYNFSVQSSSSNPNGRPFPLPGGVGGDTINAPVYQTPLAVYTCPSDTTGGTPYVNGPARRAFTARIAPGAAACCCLRERGTDYSGAYKSVAEIDRGTFGNDGSARIADIVDGTTNTILVGESKQRGKCTGTADTTDNADIFGPFWGAGLHTCCHGYTPRGDVRFTINGRYNTGAPTAPAFQYAWGMGSHHVGGAHFVLGDGSVRFISENVSYVDIFQWLNRPGDRTILGEF